MHAMVEYRKVNESEVWIEWLKSPTLLHLIQEKLRLTAFG